MTPKPKKQSGFSLLEMLLAVAVMATLMLAIFGLLQSYARKELARATREYMTLVAEAAAQVLSTPATFNALYNATLATGGGFQMIADSGGASMDNIAQTFVRNGTTIQASRLLNANFSPVSPIRSQIRVLLRIADNPAISTDTRALDILVITTAIQPDEIVIQSARTAGAAGGWIRTYAAKAAAAAQSAYGSWNIPLSAGARGVQATSWFASLPGSLNSPTQGSYLALYKYVNEQDMVGDYLYRHPDTVTAGQRNTMYGALSLGNNNIVGADDVNVNGATPLTSADCAGSTLCVNSIAISNGTALVRGSMTVEGSAYVADSANTKVTRIQNGLTPAQRSAYSATGQVVVDNQGSTQDAVSVTGTATFQDGVLATTGALGTITSTTTLIPASGTLTTKTLASKRLSSSTIAANNLAVNNRLKVGVVNNGNIAVTGSGAVGVIDIRNTDKLTYGTEAAAGQRTLSVPAVSIGTMSVTNFGTCDNGCGN